MSQSLTKRLAAVVKKALAALGPGAKGRGSGRTKLLTWEPRVSFAECVLGGDSIGKEPIAKTETAREMMLRLFWSEESAKADS